MSFLDWPIEDRPPDFCTDYVRRRSSAARLIKLFAFVFPAITYRIVWTSPLINAQAWRLGEARNVYLYGGLVRHPLVTRAGLALALAHETGHHLGGEPRDPDIRWMTWQGQADYWAAKTGMPAVFGNAAKSLTLRGGLEITNLERQLARGNEELVTDLSPAVRLEIFEAGVHGKAMPARATDEFASWFWPETRGRSWAL